jgi:hypothetical protein
MQFIKPVTSRLLLAQHKWLFIISFALFFLSYAFNIFGVGSSAANFLYFQKDSESLITNKLNCQRAHHIDIYGGQLVTYKNGIAADSNACDSKRFEPYISQFGLQGKLVTLFAPHNQSNDGSYLRAVKTLLVSLLAALMALFVVAVAREFTVITAMVVSALLCVSEWMVYYARNLYWVPFLLFAPFVFSFVFYPRFRSARKRAQFYVVLGTLIFIKCLCGYEFLTSIILSAFVAIVYHEVRIEGGIKWRMLLKPLLRVGLAGVVGFALALSAHVAQATAYYHTFSKAVGAIEKRAAVRTIDNPSGTLEDVVHNFQKQAPEVSSVIDRFYPVHELNASQPHFYVKVLIVSAVQYSFLGLTTLPVLLRQPFGVILQSMLFAALLAGIIIYGWKRRGILKSSSPHLALAASTVLGLLSSASWLILAQGHALNHPHLNGIVFYLPFALVYYIVLGVMVDSLVKKVMS